MKLCQSSIWRKTIMKRALLIKSNSFLFQDQSSNWLRFLVLSFDITSVVILRYTFLEKLFNKNYWFFYFVQCDKNYNSNTMAYISIWKGKFWALIYREPMASPSFDPKSDQDSDRHWKKEKQEINNHHQIWGQYKNQS